MQRKIREIVMDVFGMGASLMARSYFSCPIFSGNKNCLQGQKNQFRVDHFSVVLQQCTNNNVETAN